MVEFDCVYLLFVFTAIFSLLFSLIPIGYSLISGKKIADDIIIGQKY